MHGLRDRRRPLRRVVHAWMAPRRPRSRSSPGVHAARGDPCFTEDPTRGNVDSNRMKHSPRLFACLALVCGVGACSPRLPTTEACAALLTALPTPTGTCQQVALPAGSPVHTVDGRVICCAACCAASHTARVDRRATDEEPPQIGRTSAPALTQGWSAARPAPAPAGRENGACPSRTDRRPAAVRTVAANANQPPRKKDGSSVHRGRSSRGRRGVAKASLLWRRRAHQRSS